MICYFSFQSNQRTNSDQNYQAQRIHATNRYSATTSAGESEASAR